VLYASLCWVQPSLAKNAERGDELQSMNWRLCDIFYSFVKAYWLHHALPYKDSDMSSCPSAKWDFSGASEQRWPDARPDTTNDLIWAPAGIKATFTGWESSALTTDQQQLLSFPLLLFHTNHCELLNCYALYNLLNLFSIFQWLCSMTIQIMNIFKQWHQ